MIISAVNYLLSGLFKTCDSSGLYGHILTLPASVGNLRLIAYYIIWILTLNKLSLPKLRLSLMPKYNRPDLNASIFEFFPIRNRAVGVRVLTFFQVHEDLAISLNRDYLPLPNLNARIQQSQIPQPNLPL